MMTTVTMMNTNSTTCASLAPLFRGVEFTGDSVNSPRAYDAHVLLWDAGQLVGHEYLLSLAPEQCNQHLDELSAQFDFQVSYGDPGRWRDIASQLPMLASNPHQRFEDIAQWFQRDPGTVHSLLEQAQAQRVSR